MKKQITIRVREATMDTATEFYNGLRVTGIQNAVEGYMAILYGTALEIKGRFTIDEIVHLRRTLLPMENERFFQTVPAYLAAKIANVPALGKVDIPTLRSKILSLTTAQCYVLQELIVCGKSNIIEPEGIF